MIQKEKNTQKKPVKKKADIKKKTKKTGIKLIYENLKIRIQKSMNPEARQHIEIYKQKVLLKTPIYNSHKKVANCKIGDFIMIVDDIVWVYDYSEDKKEHYSQATYNPEFVRLNPNLFEKQTK